LAKGRNGIIISGILVAFVIGVISANPVVDAAGGWQVAFDDLLAQITSNDVDIEDHENRVTSLENSQTKPVQVLQLNSQSSVLVSSNQQRFINHDPQTSVITSRIPPELFTTSIASQNVGIDGKIDSLHIHVFSAPADDWIIRIYKGGFTDFELIFESSINEFPINFVVIENIDIAIAKNDRITVSVLPSDPNVSLNFNRIVGNVVVIGN